MRRILLILMMMNVMSPFTYLKANNPDYVGDVNAEAQPICFDSEGIYTYPLNPNGYGYDEADVLNPNIDFDLGDGNDFDLIAPSFFYLEPTTNIGFSVKVTKTITSGEGTNIDYICFRVPKSADPLALTYATTGADNAISYDYEYNNEDYFTIDFPADPNEEYNYVLVTFNMCENHGNASPTGNIVFELVEPEIPTELPTQTITINGSTSMVYGCHDEEYTIELTDATVNANPSGTKYHYVVRLNNATSGTIIAEEESYEHSFSFTPGMQDGIFVNNLYAYVTATYDPGYLCESVVLTKKSGNKQVRIYKKPTADFTYTASCKTVTFTSTSTNINPGASAPYPYYTWIIKDKDGNVLHTVSGSVANNPEITTLEYTFEEDGEYDVTLQAAHSSSKTSNKNQCYDEITKTITVTGPDASFTVNPNPAGRNKTVTFTINNYNGSYTYSWDFGNGNIASGGPSVTTTYANTGTYNAKLTVKDGDCEESSTQNVVISDCDHSAEFTIEPNPTCYGEYFTCTVDNPVPGAIYKWYYQSSLQLEGVNEDEFSAAEFGNIGLANITLEMTVITGDESCTVTHTEQVDVKAKRYIGSISAYDPNTGNTLNDGAEICRQTHCQDKLQFNYTPSAGTTIESTDEFLWDFGDGTTSTERNPEHLFDTDGTKEVTLTVTTKDGCTSDPAIFSIDVTPVPSAEFIMVTPACEGEYASFEIINPVDGAYYEWWIEDATDECENIQPQTSAEGTNKTTFEASGSGTIYVIARARSSQYADCFDGHKMQVTFDNHIPTVTIEASESVCFGSGTVTFTALSDVEDVTYEWTVNGEPYTYENDNMIEFSEVGLYEVSVVAKSGDGCESDPSGIVSAEVYEKPFVFLDKLADSLCYGGGYLTFVARSEGAYEYIWTVNGEAYHETDSEIEFSEVGEYNVSVSAVSENGCVSDPLENTATIFDYFQIRVCNDTTIGNNSTANLYAINGNSVDTSKYSFRWEPAELVVNPDALVTETVMLTETTTFILRATNKICGECSSFDDVLVEVMSATPVEFVDLGLSVKWASQNVEASSVENSGEYFLCAQLPDLSFSNVGRLPTKEEMHELKDLCEWKWTTQNGVNGYLVTSKTNGNSIFIPAAGYYYHRDVFRDNEVGNYWISTSSDSINYYLFISNRAHSVDWNKIDYGRNIRLVTE